MNYPRLYQFRFQGIHQESRTLVWNEIARFMDQLLNAPQIVLDPAAGRGEFIHAISAKERWVVDCVDYHQSCFSKDIHFLVSDIFEAKLPENYFDAIFVSNFLEHLTSQEKVAEFLAKMFRCLKKGGQIAILGPNFKYCMAEYFDCADHTLALTHVAITEHLIASEFTVMKMIPRFLPYSFRGFLPHSSWLIRWYLKIPMAWRIFGKQFLCIAQK